MDTVLGEFIDLAPACAHTASLKTVLECFGQEQCEQIVIIDEQQRPLGLLRLATLIFDRAAIFDPAAATSLLPWQRSTANLQECSIQELMATKNLLRLEPLILLELQSSLNQFQPHLSHLQRHQYGLVDPAGRYQGLLDRLQLLQFLITHPIKSIAPTISTFAQLEGLSLQASEADDRGQLGSTPLSDLIKLIDQLPLPLMLQTSAGQVVSQNQTWQQQVGKLQDPQEIRQAAAAWLRKTIDLDRSLNAWDQEPELIDSLNFCYGSDINSCVCVCPMKSGQDQVWKFLKIPLEVGFNQRDVRTGDQAGSPEDLSHWAAIGYCPSSATSQSSALFQLATLELAPHLSWQGQTEPLPLMGTLWLIVAQDTTEQQQVAKELTARNADLMQLNRLQNEFLASISHELKTPLTAILGLSSLLQDEILGELNDRQIRYARMIHQGGRQLVLIVNDILDLTRMETGQLDLTLEIVGLENVCTSAYEQARQAHKNKAVDEISAASISQEPSFSLEIEPAIESLVADRLRLRQMLSNLLLNALEFTDASGKIGLKVEQWENWIAFTIWDNGVGIPTHEQHLIFQKFQQLANPLTQQFEGTGLGLVLTQRLARLHGGEVTFTSIEGQGSQFTLLLPPNPTQVNQGRDRALETTSLKSTSLKPTSLKSTLSRLVLVVEAVPQFLERLTRQLTDLGYRVVIARSGTEALEKARRLQPAVVFLNPVLPLLSGWDLLTLIKSEPEIRHIPIVVTATLVEKTQAFHNGADGFISLPVQPEVLRQTLERLLDVQVLAPAIHPLSKLTVLHLFVGNTADSTVDSKVDSAPVLDGAALSGQATVLPVDLHTLLHPHHRRIVEVDDLEQADLLARIWKPNVLLLDGRLTDPIAYLKRLSQCTFLASLPLVTLTTEITQAANQVGLTVFPCLADDTVADRQSGAPSTLLQVLQVAAEVNRTPHILLVDLGALPDSIAEIEWEGITASTASMDLPIEEMDRSTDVPTDGSVTVSMQVRPETEWLQSTAQSLQIAGITSSITDSWSQVMHHLHHQSVDLLLLRTDQNQPHPSVLRVLQTLVQLEYKPPILVCQAEQTKATTDWLDQIEAGSDRTTPLEQGNQSEQAAYMQLLRAIATQFLSPSLSIKDLLQQINQNLRRP
jgi:signal transduction histidine kinase/CheY-like chemotaxis protein